MTKNIFLDFDGTLIDSRQRLYTLFMELVPTAPFSFDEYWKIKRGRVNQMELLSCLHLNQEQIAAFKKAWMEKIEDEHRLRQDVLLPNIIPFLAGLSKKYSLYLVTGRQHPERAEAQLEWLGLRSFFTKVLVTKQATHKAPLVLQHVSPSPDDIFVGDMGEDVQAGKELGIRTVVVLTGFLSKEILQEYKPDLMIESVDLINEACSL